MPSRVHDPILLATLAERQRIARDLHDGVATRLIMLLASLPVHSPLNADIVRGLQECLLELQMTVDGLGAERMSLAEMLGNLRYRFEPAFRRSGMKFQWEVSDLALEARDDSRIHRELCKIAQEALANALRHSGASSVQVRLAPGRGNTLLTLEVSDNGRGLPDSGGGAAPRTGGQGLRSMRARAESIGASISISNLSPRGLRVRVTLPLTGDPTGPDAVLAA
ncbi:signal transduction histidine kinase [Variovorax boronicumulans]|uniref:sensor histidine kinase n=1 Tax=Variovorax boronicumulans TaxID=436515 RepID=UPI0024730410|nr:ATP-binding protein [Variovorax boronicumulans]MDH6165956.1 signal transduction histidine kinase [Variovorax boronicumulans]